MNKGFLDMSDVGDDELSQILGLSTNASQQNKLELQMRLANALRAKGVDKGQVVPGGSVFLPPSPLTTAMDQFDHLQGIVSGMQGKKQGDQLDADRQRGLERFAKLWFSRNKGMVPGAQPGSLGGSIDPSQQNPLDPAAVSAASGGDVDTY